MDVFFNIQWAFPCVPTVHPFYFSFEWGIVEKRVEKLNVLMLILEERHVDCMYSEISFENPHLIHNLPLVALITLTLRPCRTCTYCHGKGKFLIIIKKKKQQHIL
jgi:hypothetical protein